jgi:hypothetical protein
METERTKDFTEENLYSRTQRFEALAWDHVLADDAAKPIMDTFRAEGMFDFYVNDEGRKFTKKKKRFSHLTTSRDKVTWGPTTDSARAFRAFAVHYKIEKWLTENTKEHRESFELLYQTKVKVFNLEEIMLNNSLFFMPLGGEALKEQQADLQSLLKSLEDNKRLVAEGARGALPDSDDDDDALFERPKKPSRPPWRVAEFDY